jgi:Glucodextranase, domain B
MTMLDDRARAAVEAINRSVAERSPAAVSRGFGVVKRRHAIWAGAGWALAGSAAAAAVVGAAMFTPSPEPDVATTLPETTVVTTEVPVTETTVVPAPKPEVAPPPVTEPTTSVAPTAAESSTTTLDATPPDLSITSPKPNEHFEEKVVTFSGVTEPGATVVAGGKWEASVNAEGGWSISLVLSPGANGASFVATDGAGNTSSARITVYYDAPAEEQPPKEEPPPEEEPPPDEGVEFTAFNTYGSCEETPPYDVYHGTADPGTTVTISSEYGSASVYVGPEGGWEKKVYFETAPYGVGFVVTVRDHNGATKQFEFVSWAGGV